MLMKQFIVIWLFNCIGLLVYAQASTQISIDSLLVNIARQQNSIQTLSEKCIITYDDGNTAQQFNCNIRLKTDSAIWLSLSMLGFEGARSLITPDSFRLVNKLTGEYTVSDVASVRQWLLFPVNFSMLQHITTGCKIDINPRVVDVVYEDSAIVLYEENDKLLQKTWVNTESYTLKKMLLKDKLLKQDMTINFDAYNYSLPRPFSNKRSIVITRGNESIHLSIDVTRVSINENVSFPFEVSDRYKRTE